MKLAVNLRNTRRWNEVQTQRARISIRKFLWLMLIISRIDCRSSSPNLSQIKLRNQVLCLPKLETWRVKLGACYWRQTNNLILSWRYKTSFCFACSCNYVVGKSGDFITSDAGGHDAVTHSLNKSEREHLQLDDEIEFELDSDDLNNKCKLSPC